MSSSESQKLLNCPFCGGKAIMRGTKHYDGEAVGNVAWVMCTSCGATGSASCKPMPIERVQEEAAECWNRRHERECRFEQVEPGWWECSECADRSFCMARKADDDREV